MTNSEIKITKLTAESLAKILGGILDEAGSQGGAWGEIVSFRSSIKTLIKTLGELN